MTQAEQRTLGFLDAKVDAINSRLVELIGAFNTFVDAHNHEFKETQEQFRNRIESQEIRLVGIAKDEGFRVLREYALSHQSELAVSNRTKWILGVIGFGCTSFGGGVVTLLNYWIRR